MIELRNVFYSVPSAEGPRAILHDVSLQVAAGSITCIMGASGSGKTTLLRLIAGLLKPDSGAILLDGHDIAPMRERELNELRAEMGFVFQYSALFDSLSVGENVGFGLARRKKPRAEIKKTVAHLLEEVGLPDVAERLPGQLSGGQRKRVAMARALATEPKLVLYDEPVSGLDPIAARVIDDLILQMRAQKKTTNVVVSHHLGSIFRIADHVMMLHEGRIIADGSAGEIKNSEHPAVRQFIEGRAEGPITA